MNKQDERIAIGSARMDLQHVQNLLKHACDDTLHDDKARILGYASVKLDDVDACLTKLAGDKK